MTFDPSVTNQITTMESRCFISFKHFLIKSVRNSYCKTGRGTESYGVYKGVQSRFSDTIASFVNNIQNELPVNNICEVTLYLADTHLNVYIYSRRRLVFLEKRSVQISQSLQVPMFISHLQLPSANNRSTEKNNQTAQLSLATPK